VAPRPTEVRGPTGGGLTVEPISAAEHLAFVRRQRSVIFLQTPAWARVKTEWRGESLGWYDGGQLVGAGLVLHRPVPREPSPSGSVRHVMEDCGFGSYACEWWHYTLKGGPYPNTYFDFPVT